MVSDRTQKGETEEFEIEEARQGDSISAMLFHLALLVYGIYYEK